MMDTGISDRHLNAVVALTDGRLLLAGESGVLARSDDDGQTWTELDDVYPGSFFGALALPDNGALVFGMRGHVFRSEDGGDTWTQSVTPNEISLFGGRGSILGSLCGALIVGVFSLGLRMVGTDPQWTYLLIGLLIILAVGIDQWIRKVAV